ncbi:hypothetical protein Patl1_00921 [Pistacia atlantica]|uniref:Uncharacterized protein n=1 Tax=Pistacia atlantica TaxID=434234 RepID=A0ACC1C8N5_9ROSI|nr:hypothetical protein Patl1_00921 [Pistacia atlantica]
MATETAKAGVSDTEYIDSIQPDASEQQTPPHRNASEKSDLGKTLAHRAVYGTSSRRGGSRKERTNDVRTLPSRLSKVSLADDTEN